MSVNTKKLIILKDKIAAPVFEKYAQLVLTISHLEWFLQEVLIFIILKTQFDQSNKSHVVLADFISKSSFDKKIELIKQNNLLSEELMAKLDIIRSRRNIFIHGIILEEDGTLVIKIIHRNLQEKFTEKNIFDFLDFVEKTGGELIIQFESQGFKL
ncbi:MAG: hypothetical protein V1891_03650 [bacterium]